MAERALAEAPPTFALAGHSMGGRVALEIVRRARERVSRLALLDTGFRPRPAGAAGEDEKARRLALLALARAEGMRAMAREWVRPMVHPDRLADIALIEAILDMLERRTPAEFAGQIEALLARPDATPLLPSIRCPTLVLCGRDDAWSTLAQHEEMAARIPGARLAVVERCGHMAPMERPREVGAMRSMRGWRCRCRWGHDRRWATLERHRSIGSRRSDRRPLVRARRGGWRAAAGVSRWDRISMSMSHRASSGNIRFAETRASWIATSVAVKREPASRGGSQAMHERVRAGERLTIGAPRNNFELAPEAAHHLLIAGGIGITPLLAMSRHLVTTGASFQLVYFSRSIAHTAFHELLSGLEYRGCVSFHYALEPDQVRAYLRKLLWTPRGRRASVPVRSAPVHGPGGNDGGADLGAGGRAPRILRGGSGGARRPARAFCRQARPPGRRIRDCRMEGRSSRCWRTTVSPSTRRANRASAGPASPVCWKACPTTATCS